MQQSFAVGRLLGLAAALCVATVSHATPVSLSFDSITESKTFTAPLNTASPIAVDGLLNGTGAFVNTLTFTAGTSALAFSAGWLTAPPANRTVGFNIDLFDVFNNTLVGSDTFQGSVGSLATSTLLANVTAGAAYRLVTTGNAIGFGRYHIDLVDGAVVPAIPSVAAATPNLTHYTFDTHVGAKAATASLAAGDEIIIDGVPAQDRSTALIDSFTFRIGAGPLSAGIVWIVDGPANPLRTTGVNVDVFDFNNNLVVSDTFISLIDGQAFSQFSLASIGPGEYRLVLTGIAPNAGGRFRIDLSTTTTAPGFVPIEVTPTAVPEPAPTVLLLIGATGLLLSHRRGASASSARST